MNAQLDATYQNLLRQVKSSWAGGTDFSVPTESISIRAGDSDASAEPLRVDC